MQTPNGQSPCNCKANQVTVSEESIEAGNFTQAQIELLKQVYFHGAGEMAKSLRLVHDLALYQSEVPLDRQEKDSLYDVIALSKVLKRVD